MDHIMPCPSKGQTIIKKRDGSDAGRGAEIGKQVKLLEDLGIAN